MKHLVFLIIMFTCLSCDEQKEEAVGQSSDSVLDSSLAADTASAVKDSRTDGDKGNDRPKSDIDSYSSDSDSASRDTRNHPKTCEPSRAPRCPEPNDQNTSPYVCDDDCGTVTYESTGEFEIPDLPASGGPFTAEELKEKLGGLPNYAVGFKLPADLTTNEDQTDVYAQPGDDITLHFAAVHNRDTSFEGATLELTALLNYQPVEATYKMYNGDRSKILAEKKDIGAEFPVEGTLEIVEITIPASAFDRKGRYDIGFMYSLDGIDFADGSRLVRVYYGGQTRPDHQCARRGKINKMNEDELEIVQQYFSSGFIYPGANYSESSPLEEIAVSPGEKVAIDYSLFPWTNDAKTAAVVPIVDGKPRNQRMLAYMPQDDDRARTTGFRDRFVVEMPSEPGLHEVELGIWLLPYLDVGEEPGWQLPEVLPWPGKIVGTNELTFRVEK